MSSNGHFHPSTPTSDAALALRALLDRASALRLEGREKAAVACGPAILEAYFAAEQDRPLNRRGPRGFTEKLFCRLLDVHERGCPTYSTLSDKLAVRDFVAARVGERFLTPLLWSGDDAREIPWDRLPPELLLKCNEGSGKGARLAAPYQPDAAQVLALRWQAQSYYWFRREFHYWDVPRRLLIEERLDDGHPDGPIDYIFFCFDGVPRLAQVGSRSHTIHRFFTPDWEPVELTYRDQYETPHIPRPSGLSQMLEAAAALSAGFDFVRVDFYCCGDEIRFGELTFTPRAGWIHFKPAEWDQHLGDWWHYSGLPDS